MAEPSPNPYYLPEPEGGYFALSRQPAPAEPIPIMFNEEPPVCKRCGRPIPGGVLFGRDPETGEPVHGEVCPPPVAGYIVAGPDRHGRMEADWDGEIHPDRAAGHAALKECREAGGLDWGLYALVRVTPESDQEPDTRDED